MIIKSLELNNFRNYENLSVKFNSDNNIFYGDNAQGKTNILEAIYMCGTTKSHKGAKDREVIRIGEDEAHIKMIVEKKGIDKKIDMHLKRNKSKGAAIDGIPIKKSEEIFGVVNIVFFSPEDMGVIKNGPEQRRKFIDMELCQLDKIYLHNLENYNKTIKQRNNLLKQINFNPGLKETLFVWNEQLVKYGSQIIKRRNDFVDEISELVQNIHYRLSGKTENLKMLYEPNVSVEEFETKVVSNQDKDIFTGTTTVGPHRDDICFQIKDVDIRRYGSQGQQRTSALSLKLAEIELVKNRINDDPVLLLDDVLSELDRKRQTHLLDSLVNTQTIITCTGLEEFVTNRFNIDKTFKVINGNVYEDILT